MKLLSLTNFPIYEQLKIEEALLRTSDENYCIINQGSPKAIVLGISGTVERFVHPKAAEDRIPLIKRFSGGGTVVVDKDTLFVSFICQGKDLLPALFPEPIMRWSTNMYQKAFAIPSFGFRENDYVIGENKCGGNAQYIRKNRFVHHTTFLWDFQSSHMDYLLHPKKTPNYRQGRKHVDFLCKLKDYFPGKTALVHQIQNELQKHFKLSCITLHDVQHFLKKEHRKATELLNF